MTLGDSNGHRQIQDDTVTQEIEPVDMLPKLTATAVRYINTRKQHDQPFFLYVPWSSPHSPVVPSPQWHGKSGLNAHADFVMQTDDSFGQVVQALRDTGLLDNTLIICSSDNGTSAPTSKLAELQAKGHYPTGDLRGSKADIWDRGHRVPFLVSWPGVVASGARCDRLVCLTDVMKTVADILDLRLEDDAAEDSFSFLAALQGRSDHARRDVIHHSISGYFAIRRDHWKLSLCPDSGGWTTPKPTAAAWKKLERDGLPLVQLNDMAADLGEQNNLASRQPVRVKALRALLAEQIANGRSTPGTPRANDVEVQVDKRPGRRKK